LHAVFLARSPAKESAIRHNDFALTVAEIFINCLAMPEIAKFVNGGAASITPLIAEKVLRQLPQWKLEFTQINAPKFPHLVNQLEFLADAVEDAVEGAYKELPYAAVAQAVFALLYAHKKMGLIPESILDMGRADDSSVVRAVLIQNEKAFAIYAGKQGVDWQKITSRP
jgi:uncharacterized membrane protein YkvA (DUF1232 family)